VIFASRMVILVSFSTACESFKAIKLKFCTNSSTDQYI
jgi:hypothetical protein